MHEDAEILAQDRRPRPDHLLTVINDILDLSKRSKPARLELEQIAFRFSPVSLPRSAA